MNPGTAVAYAGNSLQTTNIMVSSIDIESMPTIDAKVYPLAHSNQSKIPVVLYPSRTVTISGTITSTSIPGLDGQLDIFRGYFIGQDQNLDVGYNGSTRRFIATPNKVTITRPGGLTYAKFTVEFICTQPFGQDTTTTSLVSATGRTSASYSDSITVAGSAPVQLPVITLTYTAVSGTGTITVGNPTTAQQITTASRTFANGDVIVIDSTQKTVTVNGIGLDFSGPFPQYSPSAALLSYSDTLTSRTFNISAVYTVAYL